MCSGMMLQDATWSKRDGHNPLTADPRRNSVPPTKTLIAKHLLAYLPRPLPESARHAPYSKKLASKSATVTMMSTEHGSLIISINNNGSSSSSIGDVCPPLPPPSVQTQNPPASRQSPQGLTDEDSPCLYAVQAAPPPDPCTEDTLQKPPRSNRGRHLKRFTSRWGSNRSNNVPGVRANGFFAPEAGVGGGGGNAYDRRRCKLLGDDPWPPHGASSNQRQRYVTKDGKCRVNLGPIEDKTRFLSDIFTTLVDLQYRWFLLVFTLCYIVTWVAFAGVYYLDAWLRDDLAHMRDPQWPRCYENVDGFLSALLLSVESQRTIGYGSRMVTADCPEGVVLLMAQSILGSIIDALMVGCMFVKISRPQQRAQTLIFSKHCVISERDGQLCLLFRIGDLRASHMVDAKIRAKLVKSRQTKEGEFIPLEQSEINVGYETGGDRLLLVEPQTITHFINESSPFWEVGAERLTRETFEIIVILEGIVEASGMTCQARTSYTKDEILWGHRFESCISLEKGAFQVDYTSFDKTFEVQMSPLSAQERAEKDQEESKPFP